MRMTAIAISSSVLCLTIGTSTAEELGPTGYKPMCDNAHHLCRTSVREVHMDDPGATRQRFVYDAPSGVTFTNPVRGVELEAGGADHHVHVFLTGAKTFECEWYAEKKLFGDNGLAKGYCEVTFTGTAP